MIRRLEQKDIQQVMSIWLHTNREAHPFVATQYWYDMYPFVQDSIGKATVYVYEEEVVLGFIGVQGEYIAGLFVTRGSRGKGIGKALLDKVKSGSTKLTLNVYKKNKKALAFYEREGFRIIEETKEEDTLEEEYVMEYVN